MPSDKFLNLDEHKKQKLIASAKNEFTIKKYENVSINKIIQSINMPRGTFYLYFENKQDLYLYILKEYIKDFETNFIKILKKNNGDIFISLLNFYDEMIEDYHDKPSVIKNIFINMNSSQLEIALPELIKEELDGSIVNVMDIEKYNISNEEKCILLSILMPMFLHAVAISLEKKDKRDIIREHFVTQINIIKRGMEK